MKLDVFGKIYIALMVVYFVMSGFNALFNIDSKLSGEGLIALSSDGKIAFILIYCSLMVGIGVSIGLIYYFSKTWIYSALLATIIKLSFISFRLVGASIVGSLSNTQLLFIGVELVEVLLGVILLKKSGIFNKNSVEQIR